MNEPLLDQVAARTRPLESPVLASVVRASASALASSSGPASRALLEAAIGEAPMIARRVIDPEELYDIVAVMTSLQRAAALELTQTVLVVLGSAIGPQGRAQLCAELPTQWARLLDDPHDVPIDRRPAPPRDRRDGQTLATGQMGASKSVGAGRPNAAQHDSIAASDEPHADRKLSGGDGPVPEDRTLAGARR
jgi:hypothetical protein